MTIPEINLAINPELARKILTGFIKSEITRAGFERAVVGLSGGIDSALSCVLAAEALGPENVLAVRMPYKSSSSESLEHAQMVIEQFQVQSETIEITDMVDPLFARDPEMSKVRKGNIMARSRMIVLYDWWSGRATRLKSCSDTAHCGVIRLRPSTRSAICTKPRCDNSPGR